MSSEIQLDFFPNEHRQSIIPGDCLNVMRSMAENSIDFIVTDPPYGLHFMGKKWDGCIPAIEIWAEALRICKPGSVLAAFGGSRTHHHLMCAIEGAGWEIRDVVMYIYGQGFPKSHNFGKKLGGEWEGFGTSLKPAYEPIIIAMKPLDGTFAQNARKWGVAGINIDESRIGNEKRINPSAANNPNGNSLNMSTYGMPKNIYPRECQGRWPANLIFDEEAAKELDEMTGILKSGSGNRRPNGGGNMFSGFSPMNAEFESSSGGASRFFKVIKNDKCENNFIEKNKYSNLGGGLDKSSCYGRFFYCAKASSIERHRGLEGMPLISCGTGALRDNGRGKVALNSHPTVKPISLMKYILKLLAPPGNPICLDPFAGSGSTLIAAKELGITCIGIEKEQEYCEIARKRIENNG